MGFKALKDVITKTLLSGTEKVFINDNGVTKQTAITNFMITDPEHAGNKVTSLGSFSNDKQYPSAKCVYDELQKKQDKEPFVVKVDGNSEDGYTSNYTNSEIYEAYSAGQRVICQYYGVIECIPIYIEQSTACFATTVLESSVINVLITIASDNIQVLETPLQSKLTAGHNIDIDEDGIISASFDGLDSLPTSISNAIETHGLGWTETEEKAGFDIQWDANTEGLETIPAAEGVSLYKVSDVLDIMNPIDNLIGANFISSTGESATVTEEDMITYEEDKVFGLNETSFVTIALEDGHIGDVDISKGVWFTYAPNYDFYVTRFYKEASTEEVVHQIDQKYIPGGSGGGEGNLIVTAEAESDMSTIVASSTYSEMVSALLSGRNVTLVFTVKGFEEAPFVCTNTVLTAAGMDGGRKIWWALSPDNMNIYCTEADLWTIG